MVECACTGHTRNLCYRVRPGWSHWFIQVATPPCFQPPSDLCPPKRRKGGMRTLMLRVKSFIPNLLCYSCVGAPMPTWSNIDDVVGLFIKGFPRTMNVRQKYIHLFINKTMHQWGNLGKGVWGFCTVRVDRRIPSIPRPHNPRHPDWRIPVLWLFIILVETPAFSTAKRVMGGDHLVCLLTFSRCRRAKQTNKARRAQPMLRPAALLRAVAARRRHGRVKRQASPRLQEFIYPLGNYRKANGKRGEEKTSSPNALSVSNWRWKQNETTSANQPKIAICCCFVLFCFCFHPSPPPRCKSINNQER